MTPGAYTLPRDRDAYTTIRGYVFQVDRTLRRWLDLALWFPSEPLSVVTSGLLFSKEKHHA